MNLQEKELYHEIHPLKLFTDWSAGLIALYVLWQHEIVGTCSSVRSLNPSLIAHHTNSESRKVQRVLRGTLREEIHVKFHQTDSPDRKPRYDDRGMVSFAVSYSNGANRNCSGLVWRNSIQKG